MAETKTTKKSEKKDENFLARAAHSIRDKVHELSDDIKEKTHHKSNGNDPKKSKKKDNEKKTPSPPSASDSKHNDDKRSDSEDEDYDKPTPPITSSESKENPINSNQSKPSSTSDNKTTTTTKETISSTPQNQDDSTKKSETAAATPNKPTNTVTFKEPPSENVKAKPMPQQTSTTNEIGSEKVHLSFDGIVTVDDLLNRIDETVENSKVIIGNGNAAPVVNDQKTSQTPAANTESKTTVTNVETNAPTSNTTEKTTVKSTNTKTPVPNAESESVEPTNTKNPSEIDTKNENEPIRLNYSEIQKIGDILEKINDQPGNRRVLLENAPSTTSTSERKDAVVAPKSILKSSQDPSSAETSTKVSAVDDNEIHVNVSGVQKLDDLLDRIDETVEKLPVAIETSPNEEKKEATQSTTVRKTAQSEPQQSSAPTINGQSEQKKDQAPLTPSTTNDQQKKDEGKSVSKPNETKKTDQNVPTFHLPEHEFGKDEGSNSGQTTTDAKKKDETTEWI